MQKKNIITIVISVVILIVALAFIYRYLVPAPKNSGIMVEVPYTVVPTFNQEQLDTLKRDVKDYSQNLTPVDNGGNQPVLR
jgi:uncharacterized protein YxeA